MRCGRRGLGGRTRPGQRRRGARGRDHPAGHLVGHRRGRRG